MCTEHSGTAGTERVPAPQDICAEGDAYYRRALAAGSAPAAGAPACLRALGLLRTSPDDDAVLVPVPPDIAAALLARPIERAIQDQERALWSVRSALARAEAAYREAGSRSDRGVGVIPGEEAMATALGEAARACRADLATARPGGGLPEHLLARDLPGALDLCGRGIRVRVLYQHPVRAHGPTLAYAEKIADAGAEVRTLAEVFDPITVFDRAAAFVPAADGAALLAVRHPETVRHLLRAFDYAWDRAEPVLVRPPRHHWSVCNSPTRQAVLRLMLEGHTDKAISRQLGVSTRTVATHIKWAAEQLRAESRAQLGYLIGRSGLLHVPPPQERADAEPAGE
jgi:hypothetical protein